MLAGWHAFERKLEQHSGRGLRERDGTRLLPVCVLEHGLGRLRRLDRNGRHRQHGSCSQDRSKIEKLHALSPKTRAAVPSNTSKLDNF